MRSIRAAFVLVACLCGALLAAGCGGGSDDGATAAGDRPAASTGNSTLVVADTAVASELDPDGTQPFVPAQLNATLNLYDPLLGFAYRENGAELGGGRTIDSEHVGTDPEPVLVERWTRSDDGLTYTLKLREGVMSNHGNELTAEDVVWTYKRNLGKESFGWNSWVNRGFVESLRATDRYEVTIKTRQPNASLVALFGAATFWLTIDSTEAKKHVTPRDKWADEWLRRNSAGFGPYEVKNWRPGQTLELVARDDYWGEKPQYETVRIMAIPEASARVAALTGGDVDIALNLPPDAQEQVDGNPGTKLIRFEGGGNVWLYANFDPRKQPKELTDPRVRQALANAIPYDDILEQVYMGRASEARTLIPPFTPFRNEEFGVYSYDPERARELLAEAGLENGFRTTLLYDATRPAMEAVATALQESWREIGVDVRLRKVPTADITETTFAKNCEICLRDDAGANLPDPAGVTTFWVTGSTSDVVTYNRGELFDRLHAAGLSTFDPAERQKVYDQAQQQMMEDLPIIPVAFPDAAIGAADTIENYTWRPDGGTVFASITG